MSLDLGRRGILVLPLHPGWVRTDMGGARAEIDVATSVSGMRQVISALNKETSGKFLMYNGEESAW
jgi:NAD(P)-dependent dehydrogenase (short-subunit alcohol dehydrogenase family)